MNKKTFMKSISLILGTLTFVSVLAMSVSASHDNLSASSRGRSFTKAWQSTTERDEATLTFGYNTTFINEDYAWAYRSDKLHWAEIKNGNGWHYGGYARAGKWSKQEVRHSGSSIYYCCAAEE